MKYRRRIAAVPGIICIALAFILSPVFGPEVVARAATSHYVSSSSKNRSDAGGLKVRDTTNAPPSPTHLIVGASIKLPSALYLTQTHGPGGLITAVQAMDVTRAMWSAWQTAINENDTRALTQLASPGPVLNGTIYNCADTGTCENPNLHPEMGKYQVTVPLQHSYPLYFLASIETTNEVGNYGSPGNIQPWMYMDILTKTSPSKPWQLSFQTGYAGNKKYPLQFQGFATSSIHLKGGAVDSYNPAPSTPPPVPTKDFLPLLAQYWQSYKYVGHAPADSKFEAGGYTSENAAQYAEGRNGSIYVGHRQTYRFSADPAVGTWTFTMLGGNAMVCGTVEDDALDTAVTGPMNQNAGETNYGPPLAPGEYLTITTIADHDACVSFATSGLYNVGDDEFDFKLTGKIAPTSLIELETAYNVLGEQVNKYVQQYNSCTPQGEGCVKTFARETAEQFGNFANSVSEWNYPTRDKHDAHLLEETTRGIYEAYESIADKSETPTATTVSSIQKMERTMSSQYSALMKGLMK